MIETVAIGSFGKVLKGKWNNKIVAIKELKEYVEEGTKKRKRKEEKTKKILKISHYFFVTASMLEEITFLKRLRHQRIIEFYGSTKSPTTIVMEFVPRGHFSFKFNEKKKTVFF